MKKLFILSFITILVYTNASAQQERGTRVRQRTFQSGDTTKKVIDIDVPGLMNTQQSNSGPVITSVSPDKIHVQVSVRGVSVMCEAIFESIGKTAGKGFILDNPYDLSNGMPDLNPLMTYYVVEGTVLNDGSVTYTVMTVSGALQNSNPAAWTKVPLVLPRPIPVTASKVSGTYAFVL